MAFSANDELDFGRVLGALWRRKVWIFATATCCSIVAGGIALTLPKKYVARVLVAHASSQNDGLMGALPSGLGVLASVAGIRNSGDEQAIQSIAVLRSHALVERYIASNDLLKVLFPKRWDEQRKDWKAGAAKKTPTLWKGARYFDEKIRGVEVDRDSGLISVKIVWVDPVVAAQWANGLVDLANEYIRQKAIDTSSRNIAYLEDQVQRTQSVEIKNSVYSLMESEIKKAMLARGAKEYAFTVVDPATTPEEPSSPKVLVWILAGAALGALAATIWTLVLSRGPARTG